MGERVVLLSFTAAPELQWRFILLAIALAQTDEELGHIAAGPIEHLLGWHGEQFIARVESEASAAPKFARAMVRVWRYRMSDDIWFRVQALQARIRKGS